MKRLILITLAAALLVALPETRAASAAFYNIASTAAVVTPNDSTDIAKTKSVYVGGTGNLNVDMAGGGTVLFSGIPAGTVLPIQVTRIRASSTTATLIVALY